MTPKHEPLEPPKLLHFADAEFSDIRRMDRLLLVMLDHTRRKAGKAIHVTSDIREDSEEHSRGQAVDIADNREGRPISSGWRFAVVKAAFAVGFTRIGVYDRHVHLGVGEEMPSMVMWVGTSR